MLPEVDKATPVENISEFNESSPSILGLGTSMPLVITVSRLFFG
jgi:hypothetical protein